MKQPQGTTTYSYDAAGQLDSITDFTGEDPVLAANLYSYVGNDLLNFTDPTGMVAAVVYGVLSSGDDGRAEGGAGAAANTGRRAFDIHPRVSGQLNDPRLGALRGKLTPDDLQELAHNPNANYLLDSATGNINVIQEVYGVILRITTPRDAFKIISVGRMRLNRVTNGLECGRFLPIGPGG